MKKTFKNFIAILALISMITVQTMPAYAVVPTVDKKVEISTWKKVALTIKEIASLASSIFAIYAMVKSIGEGFMGIGIASGAAGLAQQAMQVTSAMDNTANQLNNINAAAGDAMQKYQNLVGSGDISGASDAFTQLVTPPAGASAAEVASHSKAMGELVMASTAEALAFTDQCINSVNPEKTLEASQQALASAVDMAQRENIANEMRAKALAESQVCDIMAKLLRNRAALISEGVKNANTAASQVN